MKLFYLLWGKRNADRLTTLYRLGFKRVIFAVIIFIASLTIGTLYYWLGENMRLGDAYYMTVITAATVGFHEVKPLSDQGKIFTSFFIIFNLGIFAYIASVIAKYFFEGEIRNIFKKMKTENKIEKIDNHIIVCGYGRNGITACSDLVKSGFDVVCVEKNTDIIELHEKLAPDIIFLEGNATSDDNLVHAGIMRARALITTLPDDAGNVFVTLTAKGLNPDLPVITRASQATSLPKLKRAGANHVIMPEAIGGMHMARFITKPEVIEFVEALSGNAGSKFRLEEVPVSELMLSTAAGELKVSSLDAIRSTGVVIPALKSKGELIPLPGENFILQTDDIIIILGSVENVKKFRADFLSKSE